MTFETKKITTETLGEYLREVREHFNLSLVEAAHRAHIRPEFLESLEAEQYGKLPPDVYVCGFLRKLAHLYAIEAEELVAQYKKERVVVVSEQTALPVTRVSFKQVFERIIVTPKIMMLLFAVFVVLVTIGYIIFQVVSLNGAPHLRISEPVSGAVISGAFVHVHGSTDPGVHVTINDQNVFVNSGGDFDATIGVIPGQKDLEVLAENKFGKVARQTLLILVNGETVPTVLGSATNGEEQGVNLELKFSDATTIVLALDGSVLPPEQVQKGTSKKVYAHDKVVLTTMNAGATEAILNGKSLGVLGKKGEVLKDVPFFADTSH